MSIRRGGRGLELVAAMTSHTPAAHKPHDRKGRGGKVAADTLSAHHTHGCKAEKIKVFRPDDARPAGVLYRGHRESKMFAIIACLDEGGHHA